MAGRNTYLKYKRDQRLLVYWIVNSSNRIIETSASKASVAVNTTGQISLAILKSLAQLIVESGKTDPKLSSACSIRSSRPGKKPMISS